MPGRSDHLSLIRKRGHALGALCQKNRLFLIVVIGILPGITAASSAASCLLLRLDIADILTADADSSVYLLGADLSAKYDSSVISLILADDIAGVIFFFGKIEHCDQLEIQCVLLTAHGHVVKFHVGADPHQLNHLVHLHRICLDTVENMHRIPFRQGIDAFYSGASDILIVDKIGCHICILLLPGVLT